MFQDEKTTELNLNSQTPSPSSAQSIRWTERPTPVGSKKNPGSTHTVAHPVDSHSMLLKIAAAVSILLLSLWLL